MTTTTTAAPGSPSRAQEHLLRRLAGQLEADVPAVCWSTNRATCVNEACARRRALIAEARLAVAPVSTAAPAADPTHADVVEAAAKALWEHVTTEMGQPQPWADAAVEEAADCRKLVRLVLDTAATVTPTDT